MLDILLHEDVREGYVLAFMLATDTPEKADGCTDVSSYESICKGKGS